MMNISATTFTREPIPKNVLAKVGRHACNRIFEAISAKFATSGMRAAQLARRLNMDPAQLSKILGHPTNLEMESIARIYYALCGEEIEGLITEFLVSAEDETIPSITAGDITDLSKYRHTNEAENEPEMLCA